MVNCNVVQTVKGRIIAMLVNIPLNEFFDQKLYVYMHK